MRHYLFKIFLAIFAMALLVSMPLAEVSAVVDSSGNYENTIYIEKTRGKRVFIWTKFGNNRNQISLNEAGDLYGDLSPTIKENIYQENFPCVVWPKFDGFDYEIAFSKWTLNGWSPIVYLEDIDNPFDDLSPSIDFDQNARPYIAWFRDENGVRKIYISLFLETKWMESLPVSDEGVDSWDPEITVNSEGEFDVAYMTSEGKRAKTIIINFPDTITDDIDPFGFIIISKYNPNEDDEGALGQ